MSELEELKRRRMQELQQAQLQEQQELQQQIAQLESVVKMVMTKDALERYGNLRSAHPEKAVQALVVLAQHIQSGKLTQITDETFKQVLLQMQPAKKEFRITRK